MSDPYNSYDSQPVSSLQPPKAKMAPPDRISGLNISDTWKDKFRLIERAGGPDLPQFKNLPFGERLGVNFNILGFFFGPIYYLLKGLWKQAVVYFLIALALVLIFDEIGLEKITRGIGYGFAAIYSMRANISYYKKMVLGETPWF